MSEHPTGDDHEYDETVTYEPTTGSEEGIGQVAGTVAQTFGLVVTRGPRAGLTFMLGPGVTTAGRGDDNDIFLGDITVSRHHVRFTMERGTLRFEDQGSTNGTYVNMQRLESGDLRPGDEIIIGKYHLVVVEGAAADPSAAARGADG